MKTNSTKKALSFTRVLRGLFGIKEYKVWQDGKWIDSASIRKS